MDIRVFLDRRGDLVLAVVLAVGIGVETWLRLGEGHTDPLGSLSAPDAVALVAAVVLAASLAVRRRAPLVVLGAAVLAAAIPDIPPIDAPVTVIVALVVAGYSVGAYAIGRASIAGAAGIGLLVAVAVAKDLGSDQELNDVAVPALILGMPWLAGLSIRSRHEREAALEDARAEQSRAAVADERARIARDLHDAVAHSIGVIVLQARGARRMMVSDPRAAQEAVDVIESTGSEALTEMRGLVGVLLDDDRDEGLAPPPSLRHIGSLVDRVRDAGLPVELSIEGDPVELPAGLDAAAYRVIQEALTNTLTHAGPAAATVLVRYGTDRLELEIGDTGTGPMNRPGAPGGGRGLVGMRERVGVHGGRLEAGPRPGGGFLVHADLPLRPARPS